MNFAEQFERRFGKNFSEHKVVRSYTKLQTGGVADYFLEARSLEDLIDSVTLAGKSGLPFRVIGAGSKIIFSDLGFPGLVIANRANSLSFIPGKSQVIAESGISGSALVMQAANRDLAGVESLATSPGSLGGALYQNIPVYSFDQNVKNSIGSLVKKITVINTRGEILTYSHSWQKSGGASKFKKAKESPVILTVTLQLYQSSKNDILARLRGLDISRADFDGKLTGVFSDSPGRNVEELILQSRAHKLKVEGIGVDRRRPNTIVNLGGGSSTAARRLIEQIKEAVVAKTNIMLEEALEYIGEW